MSEAVTWSCSVKKKLLKISQNSEENSCARASFFNKIAGLRQLYSKRGFGAFAFLWILRNIYEHFFYRTHPVVTFWICFHLDYLLSGSYLLRFPLLHWVCIRITTDIFQILEIPYSANKYSKSTTETVKQDVKYAKS